MNFLEFIIGGVVTWHVANLLAKQNGPRDVFARLRAYLSRRQKRSGGWFDAITCVTCSSMYVGAVVALWGSENVLEWLAYTLAFSAIATIIERYMASKF